jgi:NADH dehydrogenase/NADH:ubiquinone oxidoreductase subunit G
MSTIPTKREVAPEKKTEQDAMARLTELFGAVPSAVLSDEELKAMKKQRGYEALMEFGANLMASKSPTLLGGVGEAAAATVPSIKEAGKEQREAAAAKKKETRDTQLQILSSALGIEQQEADRALKKEANNIARAEVEYRAKAPRYESEYLIQLMKNDPEAFERYRSLMNKGELTPAQAMKFAADSVNSSEEGIQMPITDKIGLMLGIRDYLMSKSTSGGGMGVSVTAPDGTTHTFPTQEAADQFKKAIGVK